MLLHSTVMSLLYTIVTFGIWPALPLTGYFLFSRYKLETGISSLPKITSFSLMTVVGIVLWSVFLLAAAILGIYRAGYFGLVGWIVTISVSIWLYKRRSVFSQVNPVRNSTGALNPGCPASRSENGAGIILKSSPAAGQRGIVSNGVNRKLSKWDWVLILGLVFIAWLYFAFPSENIFLARDEALYANHGIYIAHHGRLDIPYPWSSDIDSIPSKVFKPISGLYLTEPTITVQFAHLFPVWLAQAHATFGHHGLFRLNAIFAILSLAIFYGLFRGVMPKGYSVVAVLFLAFNPSQIWIARITLTEILTQLFIWSGLLTILLAQKNESRQLARWAGIFLGFSALVRIDCFLMVPLIFIFPVIQKLLNETDEKKLSSIWFAFYQGAIPVFVLALAYYNFYSTPYFREFYPQLKQMTIFTLASLCALIASTQLSLKPVRPLFTGTTMLVSIGIALVASTIYAYWIRPHIEPYSLINNPLHFLYGTRNYREDSLVNLSRYLSPLVVFVGILGWYMMLWRIFKKRENFNWLPVIICFAGFSVLYLWNPLISPFHFWAIRRFVPVVVPGFIFFAAIGSWRLICELRKKYAIAEPIVSILLIFFLTAFTIRADRLIFNFSENKGDFLQFKQFAEKLPRDTLIFAYGDYHWVAPLYMAFDRNVVLLGNGDMLPLYKWMVGQIIKQRPIYFLSQHPIKLTGLQYTKLDEIILRSRYSELTPIPLPRKIMSEQKQIGLYKITGLDPTLYRISTKDIKLLSDYIGTNNTNFGNEKVLIVGEWGLYEQEFCENIPVRWTNGAATFLVPLNEKRLPKAIGVDIVSTGGVKQKRVRIAANGYKLFDGQIPDGGYSQHFSLADVPLWKQLIIELLSDTSIPKEIMKGSTDSRTLGVSVKDIRLLDNDYINVNLGSEKVLGIGESGWYDKEFLDKTPVRWTNGAARLVIPLNEKRLPKAMNVEIVSMGGLKKPKRVRILANGHRLFDGLVREEGYSHIFDLSGLPLGKQLTIELLSDTHAPGQVIKGSTDVRTLGVLVKDIQLLDNDYIGVNLGSEKALGVDESGFYGSEFWEKIHVRWTSSSARLVVPLNEKRLPMAMSVEIVSTGGVSQKRVRILGNGHQIFDGQISDEPFSQVFSLARTPLGKQLIIELLSDTHIPKNTIKGSTDNRSLGVLVKDIRLLDNDYIDVNLGCEKILGAGESGFYTQELWDKIPVRWTNGAGKLVVPLNEKRLPNAVGVDIVSIGGAKFKPKRLQILANGHKLFEGIVPDEGYSALFSLSGVPLRKELTLELLSDTDIPKKVIKGSTDDRILGVLVKNISLLELGDDYINTNLGNEKVLGVSESGWHDQEFWDKMPVRWTSGVAMVVVPLNEKRLPKAIGIDIVSTGGVKEKRVRIAANGYKLFDGQIPDEGYSQSFNLADIPLRKQLTIELLSDTHRVRKVIKGIAYDRTLGVLVKGIKLLDNNYININLVSEKVLGVSESGWHDQEFWDKMPVRWTSGVAMVVVPLNEKRLPKAIGIDIVSTGGVKEKRVRIAANGYKLFDGQVPNNGYSQLLSLANVPLGKQLTIELQSDTHIPKEIIRGSTDDRALGIFVRDIRLLDKIPD